ncbi:MAG: 8-oxo-dGTP diphosphatase [Butyrivibrio sp.]|uniref:NUDIX hydrolase n=1 Tax=Butyrivibrio sp. TaxID=28121 RepID=UPI0025ED9E6F|nr:8-oxo-dGTP diphosphatase [Butyrivibrio sp.]MCR5769955.1 8-oxo-dGTP diphosphatase [Butyrivibrio sp.]
MLNTTLCYIEKDGKYLMLHRTKKKNDLNQDKWIGVGGKFEKDETPEECLIREVYEETGLTLTRFKLRSVVTFISDKWETEYMYLFTATEFEGELKDCNEGELVWVDKENVPDLPTWEGDHYFLDLIAKDTPYFSLKVRYEGEKLAEHKLIIYDN